MEMPAEIRFSRDDLYEAKQTGTLPQWASVTEEQLLELYSKPPILDVEVAELFDVSVGQVRYLRKKYNINSKRIYAHLREMVNEDAKTRLLSPENADGLAIALAHYIYRDGPIEDYHVNGQLTDDEMTAQNKYTTNKIATILYLMRTGQWAVVDLLLFLYMKNGDCWDAPVIGFEGLKAITGLDLRQ